MRFGWPISLSLHILFLFGGWIVLSRAPVLENQPEIIPVQIATISEITNVRASVKRPSPKPEPVPELPMTLETPMENAQDQDDAVVIPEQTIPDEPQTSPDKVAEVEISVEPTEPEAPSFDLDRFAAVIDRTRETQPEVGQQRSLQSEENFYVYSQTSQAAVGEGSALTLSEIDALRQKMYECWRIPADAKNPSELMVEVRVALRADGVVVSAELADPGKVASSTNSFMPIAARRAVNAVQRCGPYDFLPAEKYSHWQDMTLRFIPEF